MRRALVLASGSLACAAALFAVAYGQVPRKIEVDAGRERVEVGRERGLHNRVHKVSALIGTTVNIDNSAVGKVEDIVLSEGGCVDYLVVAEESKYTLVPWTAVKVDFVKPLVDIRIQKEKWREVPTFARESWPDLTDTRYTERIHNYYTVVPGRERRIERREDRRERP